MPVPVPSEARCHSRRARDFGGLYVALIILSFHWALVLYINSSFLEHTFSDRVVGALYTVSAALSILLFIAIPRVLARYHPFPTLVACTVLEFLAVFFLPEVRSPILIAILFLLHQSIIPILLYILDILMEALTGSCEDDTGGRRGIFLTLMSLATALSALLSGKLVSDQNGDSFSLVYTVSALLLIPFLLVAGRAFRDMPHPRAHTPIAVRNLARAWRERDIRYVLSAHFLLQIFFAWMVMYSSLYLSRELGYAWSDIGSILFVGLMAYVFLEYAIGLVADTRWGEKEMMAIGFLILAVATSWFSFLGTGTVLLWMAAMFMTRVGASLVEATTESYFFKHTTDADTALISFFRITRPLSVLIGSLLGSLALVFLPMNLIFVLLGLLMIPGIFFTMQLKDTK